MHPLQLRSARLKQVLLVASMSIAPCASAATDPFVAHWKETCNYRGTPFELRFESKSGDPPEDDMVVTLVWGKRAPLVLPIHEALFVPVAFHTDAANYCKSVGAFDWPGGRVLLLIARDDRPSYNRLGAVVLDAKTGAFVSELREVGAMRDRLMLLKHGDGYRLLLDRTWHQDANDHGEFPAPDWLALTNQGGRLSMTWMSGK